MESSENVFFTSTVYNLHDVKIRECKILSVESEDVTIVEFIDNSSIFRVSSKCLFQTFDKASDELRKNCQNFINAMNQRLEKAINR